MIEYFCVFDAAADRYIDPFAAPTMEVALRGFREACENPEHHFGKYPEDYSLWHVAHFDADLGVMTGITARKIATASSFVHTNINFKETG